MGENSELINVILGGKEANNDVNQKLSDLLNKFAANYATSGGSDPGIKSKSVFDRVRSAKVVFDWNSIKPIFDAAGSNFAKSPEISTKLREKGNEFYKQKNADLSLRAYTLAILFAPPRSDELFTAYANRSAVLMQKNRPSEALIDIDKVLSQEWKCPDVLRKALEARKQKCEEMLKNTEINGKLMDDNHTQGNEGVKSLFHIEEPNSKMPNAGAFVKLEYSEEKGRHLKVTKDVDTGTTLLVDTPFVSALTNLLTWETNHCHNCSASIVGGIPCELCSFAIFCNEACRKNACEIENGVHRYEHKLLPILRILNSSHSEIQSLRILATIGPSKLREMCRPDVRKMFQDDDVDSIMGLNEKGIYDGKSYLPIFRLVSHEPRPKLDEDSTLTKVKVVLRALVLKGILKEYSDFFRGGKKGKASQAQEDFDDFTAGLLLRHLENVKYNAISLSKLTQENKKSVGYAIALYPLISLCNHSCDPNCAPVKQSKHLKTSLVALKPLKEGEELSITYKPLYTFMKTSERQNFLAENYLFVCNCQACEENWGPGNVQVGENGIGATLILQPSMCESCPPQENPNPEKWKQCNECALKDEERAKEIEKIGEELFQCHDFMEQENWKECLEMLPRIINYFGRNGFQSYFPLYHVALDLYKRALVHSVSNL